MEMLKRKEKAEETRGEKNNKKSWMVDNRARVEKIEKHREGRIMTYHSGISIIVCKYTARREGKWSVWMEYTQHLILPIFIESWNKSLFRPKTEKEKRLLPPIKGRMVLNFSPCTFYVFDFNERVNVDVPEIRPFGIGHHQRVEQGFPSS